ncbi:GH116 family glycosyl hydrolase [Flavihumibacter fluvii]|uniref:GH116 family glycosyl hydrolase n=1 Tax=Flavihumibacter fluvii TaxID=2838157 RepID=UPI001BDF2706|nr:GH116 family glycosyl hydrolase [Flavihumibacter fluvii]ULQ54021.1 non-lysosomal glucosylceramidase [Flavihumibacter fluvii]
MKLTLLFFCSIAIVASASAQQIDPSHHVPLDKNLPASWNQSLWQDERKVYTGNELTTIGMPCGGIAAGQLYVRGDGTLANWWIANNAYNTGYGIDWLLNFETAAGPWKVCYQTFEPLSYIDQGFAVTIRQAGKTMTRQLNKKDFDNISFIGEYPIAYISYASKKNPIPLQVDATVFSPFIPLNAKESATPGTVLQYTLKNRSSEKMQVDLTGWLQNLVCMDIKDQVKGNLRNRVVKTAGMTSVKMDLVKADNTIGPARKKEVFQDFESGNYGKWKVEGTAFGKVPVTSAAAAKDEVTGQAGNFLVNSKLTDYGDSGTGKLTSPPFVIKEDYINFKLGGGPYRGKTCINLVVNNTIEKTATGNSEESLRDVSWEVKAFKGRQAYLEIIDNETGSWGHINLDEITFSNLPAKEKFFPEGHPYFGNIALSVIDQNGLATADYKGIGSPFKNTNMATAPANEKLLGATGTSFELAPGETKSISFLLTWYFPNRPMQYGEGGNWNMAIPTDGPAIGNMYANWYDNAMDVAGWLQKNLDRLTKETVNFHDTYYKNTTLPYWLVQRLMMPVSTLATETCQWWANDKFWAWEGVGSCVGTCTHVWNYEHALSKLFPELEKNIREKTDYGTSFQADGGILARNGWGGILIDGHAGGILKAYREHLGSKDDLFLSRNWDKIKKATEFIIREDGNSDGLIEKEQANTYDIAFYGANTYVGGLYLSSLKAAGKMALLMKDTAFAQHCDSIFRSGSNRSVEKLWNGEYFVQDVDLAKHPLSQYANGCLSDQLFGQTWAHLTNLGYIYPEEKVKTTLRSIWKYNWAADVGVQNQVHKPERYFANAGEPGLLVATWPKSRHMGEDGVRYRDEIWTGIEYQVATNMIYEGMIGEGLSLVKAIHERYRPEKHNPWNEIECGDHYARALASWGVLLALQDFKYDGPAKSLSFAPKVQPDNFKSFFTAAEGWGNIEQKRTAATQTNTISVAYGSLRLSTISVELTGIARKIRVLANGKEIPATFTQQDNLVKVIFDETMIEARQKIVLSISL